VVTRNGRPSFVLLSPDDLAALEESVKILQDGELMESPAHLTSPSHRRRDGALRDQV
jgi:PHD/YefM family antitoxin component YafN of YafNO toxin-antitoxin module